MYKIYTVFCSNIPCRDHGLQGALFHKGVIFRDEPGENKYCSVNSKDHERVVLAKTKQNR